jgi:hypothetical protein
MPNNSHTMRFCHYKQGKLPHQLANEAGNNRKLFSPLLLSIQNLPAATHLFPIARNHLTSGISRV